MSNRDPSSAISAASTAAAQFRKLAAAALICLALGMTLALTSENGSQDGISGAFIRIGLVLGAAWVAIPRWLTTTGAFTMTPSRMAVAGLVLLAIAAARIPVKYLVPGLLIGILAVTILRPRRTPAQIHQKRSQ